MRPIDLTNALRKYGPEQVFDDSIAQAVPWLFDTKADFEVWRSELAKSFPQNADVTLVGSALLGFSLDPERYGQKFSRTPRTDGKASDLDIAVVSDQLFHEAWNAVVAADRALALQITEQERRYRMKSIYRGFIADYFIPIPSDVYRTILDAVSRSGRHPATFGIEPKLRIYRRFPDFRHYSINTLRSLPYQL